jgi:hypothetical protein
MIEFEDIIEKTDDICVCKCYEYQELYRIILDNCTSMSSYLTCIDLINILDQIKTAIMLKHIDKCNNHYRCCK